MIDWQRISPEYNFFSIDGDGVCRLSRHRPVFNEKGKAIFSWEEFRFQQIIFAEYFGFINLTMVASHYPPETILWRPKIHNIN